MIRLCLLPLLLASALMGAETRDFLKKDDAWFASGEAKTIAANILSYQSGLGGWPKNIDLTAAPFAGKPHELVGEFKPIFDNGATTDEIRFLARLYHATKNPVYLRAVENGIDYILIAQYPTGGWPQSYPPDSQYHRHITFNDDSMVRIMLLLQEIDSSDKFDFLDADRRKAVKSAFQRGIECILKCQIKVNGKLTVWCAQHDEIDLSPRPARRFEHVSLSGFESVRIIRLLASLERPSPEVARAVEAAAAWLRASQIKGWRVKELKGEDGTGHNFQAVPDPSAKPFWARFYDIETNQPLWSAMDGIPRLGMENIGWARHGYDWTGTWAQPMMDKYHAEWQARQAQEGPGPEMTPWKPLAHIALAGDSTVTDTAGWGFGFKKAVAADVLCENFAQGGQSSKSFRDTGAWQRTLACKPDYVLVQFGHNDMPGKGPKRETDPATTYAENLTRFVKEARDAGAKPVIVTSLVRRLFEPDGRLRGELAPYAEAARKVAAEQQVPLIDLYALSTQLVEKLGSDGVEPFEPIMPPRAAVSVDKLSPVPVPPPATTPVPVPPPATTPAPPAPGAEPEARELKPAPAVDIDVAPPSVTALRDRTHLNPQGSIEFGRMVAAELTRVLPETAAFVKPPK